MRNNVYIIKNMAHWMVDELIAFSRIANYDLYLLREQDSSFNEQLKELTENSVNIYTKPFVNKITFKKIKTVIAFIVSNLDKILLNYSGVITIKSLIWFLRLDMSNFSSKSSIHAQFATQAAVVSFLIKKYFDDKPSYTFTFHAHDIYFPNKWFELLVNQSKIAFSISEYNIDYVKKSYPQVNDKKLSLSRLGAFVPSYPNKTTTVDNDIIKLGFLSWLVEKKGIFYLLEATKLLRDDGFVFELIIAGDGPLREKVLNYIRSNNLGEIVKYIGKIYGKDKEKFFRNINVFALPSITVPNDMDGIPVVLMEAVSYGLPIISTNVSGIPEICINDYNGYLVEEKNSIQLADAIKKITMNKHLITTTSKNSLEISEKYNIENNSYKKIKELGWA